MAREKRHKVGAWGPPGYSTGPLLPQLWPGQLDGAQGRPLDQPGCKHLRQASRSGDRILFPQCVSFVVWNLR